MDETASRRDVLKRGSALAALASVPAASATAAEGQTGTLDVTVYGHRVVDDELVAEPLSGIDIYDDTEVRYYRYGEQLGTTGDDGRLQAEMTTGERTFAVVEDYTRYYAGIDDGIPVTIEAGETTQRDYYFVPEEVWADIDYQTEYGEALYVTGQTEYLGNWQEAKKLGYRDSTDTWIIRDRLPIGAECKVVRGEWTDGEWISTENVDWQQGPNQVIEATGTNYPGGRLETTPEF